MTADQISIFETAAGFTPAQLYWLIGSTLVALLGLLLIKLLRGTLQGWGRGKISAYELGSRFLRLVLIFNVLIYIVQP